MAQPRASGPTRRVLIVDGDPSFGRSLQQDFKTHGFDVEVAATPDDAISKASSILPDLVVLDLHLADTAALTLLRRWKAQVPSPVVVLVSGQPSLMLVVEALNEGARRFFTKPVSADAIVGELEDRRSGSQPYLSPLVAANHQLGSAALMTEGVDRFFAISPGLLCIAGFDGYFKMLNPAWETTLGYSIDELCARPYVELIHPDDRVKATDELLEIRGGDAVFRFRNRFCCKDGSYRWLAWSATPSPAHRLIYASAKDVTKSVRMEQRLRDSNERLRRVVDSGNLLLRESKSKHETLVELGLFKDELADMIIHDLKNPLQVIMANYDYIVEGFEGLAACEEALQDSREAGRRMLRLLSNLADVQRLEVGTLDVRASEVDLAELLRSIAGQRRILARSQHVAIVVAPAPETTVDVDVDLMSRAIENIFDNALRHTPSGGSIEIELHEAGPDVEIRIGNSGTAIPSELRGTIFDKYQQSTALVGRMNLGLGLYFCRLAVEAQGGSIWIEETERMPTVFGIRLPRVAVRASASAAPGAHLDED